MTNPNRWTRAIAGAAVTACLVSTAIPASAATLPAGEGDAATPIAAPLTNLAHLDFLLDQVDPPATEGHTTYRIGSEPVLTMPWTYADARDGGTFERVGGGGPVDPVTGYWAQGAFNSDDITRAAVVYIRHFVQTSDAASREKAYQLLRSTAYFQTVTGENTGNVVLWMQPDGTFNVSPEPIELPDPSDSGESYWLARSIWALGEGYAAFVDADPEFAAFLQDRLQLAVDALDRQVLDDYGTYEVADGVQVPAWLIVDGADASAEAVLGLAAYSAAAPDDVAARTALAHLSEGIAKMSAGDTRTWPYGAILPWAQSQTDFHSWASQMPVSLARASATLGDPTLLAPAVKDSVGFTTVLLTGGGPDNGWLPTPTDTVQIAYGADSRLQSLLAVGDVARLPGLHELAGMMGAWFFGMNRSGEPVYDPATGVTFDGVQVDGTVNRNSGAESTIHGLLAMIALDGHPDVAARALAATQVTTREGLTVVEAETGVTTGGSIVKPESAWTGESLFGGEGYLRLPAGSRASFDLGAPSGTSHVEPVVFQPSGSTASSVWRNGRIPIGFVTHGVGEQGITAVPGALLPQTLQLPILASRPQASVSVSSGTVQLDSIIVRPLVSRLALAGEGASTELVHSTSVLPLPTRIGSQGTAGTLREYDGSGALVGERAVSGQTALVLQPGGFAVLTR